MYLEKSSSQINSKIHRWQKCVKCIIKPESELRQQWNILSTWVYPLKVKVIQGQGHSVVNSSRQDHWTPVTVQSLVKLQHQIWECHQC